MNEKSFVMYFLGLTVLIGSMVVPKLIVENPGKFPAINKLHKIEADLPSAEHKVSMGTSSSFTALELRELCKQLYSEAFKAACIMVYPFGELVVEINEWVQKYGISPQGEK